MTKLEWLTQRLKEPLAVECIEWPFSLDHDGYGFLGFDGRTTMHASRVAFRLFHGKYPEHFACHHCDNRKCVNPLHLFDGSVKANAEDSKRKGRNYRGPAHHWAARARIDPRKVFELREAGHTGTGIARLLNTDYSYIYKILRKERRHYASPT